MGVCCAKPDPVQERTASEVCVSHFDIQKALGSCSYGNVKIAQHKATGKQYSIKLIDKQCCIKKKAFASILQEKKMLEHLDCPFLCNIKFAFQDVTFIYMVSELKLGGDLKFLLSFYKKFNEDAVRFLMAEISLGLSFLHANSIIHRNLKPSNILIDELGHASIADLSIATYYQSYKLLQPTAGTLVYMSPEMLEKRGYNEATDWWSFGVILYELLFGKRPFRGKSDADVRHAILNAKLKYPADAAKVTSTCIDAIKAFLEPDPVARLGSAGSGGLSRITQHVWFQGVDWCLVERLAAKPVLVPDMKKTEFNELMKLQRIRGASDEPVHVEKREVSKTSIHSNSHALDEEMLKIQAEFSLYDFTKLEPKKAANRAGLWTTKCAQRLTQTAAFLGRSDEVDEKEMEGDRIIIDPDAFSAKSRYSTISEKDILCGGEAGHPKVPSIPESMRSSIKSAESSGVIRTGSVLVSNVSSKSGLNLPLVVPESAGHSNVESGSMLVSNISVKSGLHTPATDVESVQRSGIELSL
ncbi:kinase-like domain-containing protein [Chytriomyces sp. MP71]|nr:kinase-like domain-containing protein [Chytriomyces sp. MP71]